MAACCSETYWLAWMLPSQKLPEACALMRDDSHIITEADLWTVDKQEGPALPCSAPETQLSAFQNIHLLFAILVRLNRAAVSLHLQLCCYLSILDSSIFVLPPPKYFCLLFPLIKTSCFELSDFLPLCSFSQSFKSVSVIYIKQHSIHTASQHRIKPACKIESLAFLEAIKIHH